MNFLHESLRAWRFTSAPSLTKSLTMGRRLRDDAYNKALLPWSVQALILAPLPMRSLTMASWPADAAMISGVHLESSRASISLPFSTSHWTISLWPPEHAQCRAVRPLSSRALISLNKGFRCTCMMIEHTYSLGLPVVLLDPNNELLSVAL